MSYLLRFGNGDTLYTFPDEQVTIRDTLRNAVPRTERMPGADGGLDQYGDNYAPNEVGLVAASFWLHGLTPNQMQTLKDDFTSMKAWGVQTLYKRNVGGGERWCRARVNNIQFTEAARDVSHQHLQVQISFQVADPFWYDVGSYDAAWGDGSAWGDGDTWGGSYDEQTLTGTDNSYSITPTSGNDIIRPKIVVEVPTGKEAKHLQIRRVVNGAIVDELTYAWTLDAGDVLEIDCKAYSVELNGANGYGAAFDFKSQDWFVLESWKANLIKVRMMDSTDQVTVRMYYMGTWND